MSVSSLLLCICPCHQEAMGNWQEAVQWDRWHEAMVFSHSPIININVPVDARDPVEAAVAEGCTCRNTHSVALSVKGPWDFFGTPWSPEKDEQDTKDDDE